MTRLLFRKIVIYCSGTSLAYLVRWRLRLSTELCGVYVHRFLEPDVPVYHDHPWNFLTLILKGGYTEHRPWHPPRKRRGLARLPLRRAAALRRRARRRHLDARPALPPPPRVGLLARRPPRALGPLARVRPPQRSQQHGGRLMSSRNRARIRQRERLLWRFGDIEARKLLIRLSEESWRAGDLETCVLLLHAEMYLADRLAYELNPPPSKRAVPTTEPSK